MELNTQQNTIAHQNAQHMMKTGGAAIIGISPANPYFTQKSLADLARFCENNFSQTYFFLPDKPLANNFEAAGYSAKSAQRRADQISAPLRDICDSLVNKSVQRLDWTQHIENNPDYVASRKKITDLYENNAAFRQDVRQTTKAVVGKWVPHPLLEEASIDAGKEYLLSELAYVDAAPKIHGQSAAYIYNKSWPILENYIAGTYTNAARKDLGFLVLNKDAL